MGISYTFLCKQMQTRCRNRRLLNTRMVGWLRGWDRVKSQKVSFIVPLFKFLMIDILCTTAHLGHSFEIFTFDFLLKTYQPFIGLFLFQATKTAIASKSYDLIKELVF